MSIWESIIHSMRQFLRKLRWKERNTKDLQASYRQSMFLLLQVFKLSAAREMGISGLILLAKDDTALFVIYMTMNQNK